MLIEIKPLKIDSVVTANIVDYDRNTATVSVEENKLSLSKEAVKALSASAGDRIAVNYWTVSSSQTFPVIGKAEFFSDTTGGNKLTKSNTVSFRGQQKEILLEYGTVFKLEPFKNYFKMVALETK